MINPLLFLQAECDSSLLQLLRDGAFFFLAHSVKLVCTSTTSSKYLSRDISVVCFICLGCLVHFLNVLGVLILPSVPANTTTRLFFRLACC